MSRKVYIKAYRVEEGSYLVHLETLIVLNIYKICASSEVELKIQLLGEIPGSDFVTADLSKVAHEIIETAPRFAYYCSWPVVTVDQYVIAGLCSVAREIVKCSENKKVRKLLGFRDACLMACSESSIWTRFCEVDMISTIRDLLSDPSQYIEGTVLRLPPDVLRFECHMGQPVRMHNVYKVAREQKNDKEISSATPISELDLHHTFGEGLYMTLSDIILFSCMQIFFMYFPQERLKTELPLTCAWFNTMKDKNYHQLKFVLNAPENSHEISQIVLPTIVEQSLYTSDPARYKPEKRIYTKQKDIMNSLRIINSNQINIYNTICPYGVDESFDWSKIPLEANPMSGALPEKRAYRKCDQLENLARAVIKVTGDKPYRIVDFCSGSGHLGILLAYLLPSSEIILVENKEQSLMRAKERIAKLSLTNVVVLQSNLDYFVGSFDLGVSLHACGVATDLVMQLCVKNRAHFVCCPCCYGAIYNCALVTYPRSSSYQNINLDYKDYLILAHAADQTHDTHNSKTTQGFVCMDAIDTDRRLYAESFGYKVHLGKLQPCSCTNKNNLLVGILTEEQ